ncbi:uncharacterized protein LOC127725503 isoform X2 [Mytilus californianus]|uniref:uncharacterized protein LOC127725503 isoform X2 n=1 Tax=Mytilus californianus TaxID=6549 RepID=UPI0022467856|nr:uncharacterized protein LOC127725503 isoform X2 [Mytilus californianus]
MERQHWCSFCLIPFKNELSLRAHLDIHANQPPVPCSLCPLTFVHHSQLGNHIRYRHSDCIVNKFVEIAESICKQNIADITTEIESESEWTESSEEEDSIASSEEGEFLEENYKMVNTDSESVEEPVENISNEMKYILAQNGNDASDNENPVSEFDLKGINTKNMNGFNGRCDNAISCDVSFLVKLEREKAGRHFLNVTRKFPNLEDTLPLTSQRHTSLQHTKSAFFNSDDALYTQRTSYNFDDGDNDPYIRDEYQNKKTSVQTNEDVEQTPWDDEDKDELNNDQNKAMLVQDDDHDGEQLIAVNEDNELAVADVVYSSGQAGRYEDNIDVPN